MVLIWLGCAGEGAGDSTSAVPAFGVIAVTPEDGATDAVEAVVPQLRLSEGVDLATCAASAFRLDGVGADHTVAFAVPLVVAAEDGGARITLDPDGPLPHGWTYALTARGGACTSLDGARLEPFYSSFLVP